MPGIRFGVLGPVAAWRGVDALEVGSGKCLLVLAVLLLHADHRVDRDQIIEGVWGAKPPRSAVNLVQKYVGEVRRSLELDDGSLETVGTGYALRVVPDQLDSARFTSGLARARAAKSDGDPAAARQHLAEAMALWRGPAFSGLDTPAASTERARLEEYRLGALEDLAELDLLRGEHALAIPELSRLAGEHPYRERARELLMLALYRSGRQGDALAVFHDVKRLLADELGADPGHGLRRVHAQILRADPVLDLATVTGALPDIPAPSARVAADRWDELQPAAIEDRVDADLQLGRTDELVDELTAEIAAYPLCERPRAHLMTVLARSGRIPEALDVYLDLRRTMVTELGVEPSSALRALHAGVLRGEPTLRPAVTAPREVNRPQQLPVDLAGFTGRADLLAELASDLRAPDRREPLVLTISGVGGLGKTTFAVRLAHQVRDAYPDGQLFATLGDSSAATVLPRFLRALGIPVDMVPSDLDECSALLRDLLADSKVLIVLDNVQHERQVRPLLPAAPGCAVLVTSRQSLSGLEHGRRVRPGLLGDEDAARLLGTITGVRHAPDEPLLAHCGGLPLALRVAGALLAERPHWDTADLAERLTAERTRLDWLAVGDLAVRASFAISYHQLPATHQILFRRLGSLGVPTFGAWLAAAVLGIDARAAERMLEDLVGCNLVEPAGRVADAVRYRLHDLLRCFAAEKAEEEPAPARRQTITRALGGWLHLSEQAAARLPRSVLTPAPGDASRWQPGSEPITDPTEWFEAELPALHAAIKIAVAEGMADHSWELAVMCQQYFDHSGRNEVWFQFTTDALAGVSDGRGRAALLLGLGQLHIYRDRFPEAFAALRESLAISEELGDVPGIARALGGLATTYRVTGQAGAALDFNARATVLAIETGDRHLEIQLRAGAATLHLAEGRPERAWTLLEEALERAMTLGDDHRTAAVLTRCGEFNIKQNAPAKALRQLTRALEIVEGQRDRRCTARVQLHLGRAHAMLGNTATAIDVLAAACSLFVELGDGQNEANCAFELAHAAHGRPTD
ncbi:SARP family transcriptional regulator [Amycolatopsis sp. NBRC 101858]|uniref:AfsR/SARP family transcriptional regulator n=1 Tax=Amycolatopsis sp. NBRC 101858 TaxID=3032200 RepID=UPI0024A25B7F|nr:BTAD domain-containing putative transcriptional regulator [Amycolatopsis sp. NBRC 101858]GLY38302.1 SARP family transcriptional regulator [Amycolatopsis sp. NBRC 101858]